MENKQKNEERILSVYFRVNITNEKHQSVVVSFNFVLPCRELELLELESETSHRYKKVKVK